MWREVWSGVWSRSMTTWICSVHPEWTWSEKQLSSTGGRCSFAVLLTFYDPFVWVVWRMNTSVRCYQLWVTLMYRILFHIFLVFFVKFQQKQYRTAGEFDSRCFQKFISTWYISRVCFLVFPKHHYFLIIQNFNNLNFTSTGVHPD